MSRPGLVRAGVGALAAGTAAAVGAAATVSVQRRKARRRWKSAPDQLGALRGDTSTVVTADGVALHVEVDEPPTAVLGAPTLVFVHGWLLTLDSWHLQRQAFRPSHRMVFYDQRCHGRSEACEPDACTVEDLARDLARVIETAAPDGPLVLIGHSMGGMTIMEYAKQHPDVMRDRVVGLAMLGTSAGDLGQLLPGRIGRLLKDRSPSLLALGAKAPRLVHAGRRVTSGPAYWTTKRLAFGGEVPPEYVAFTDAMISASAASVIWDFWPLIAGLDQYASLAAFEGIPTLVIVGSRDVMTPVRHAYRIADLVPDSQVFVLEGGGHMIMLERADEVTKLLEELVES
jgi:pimeloyl-ACP methyl ester carboxylesterase